MKGEMLVLLGHLRGKRVISKINKVGFYVIIW